MSRIGLGIDLESAEVEPIDEGGGRTSFKASPRDLEVLRRSDAVQVEETEDNTVFVQAQNQSGVIGLPDSPDIHLRPKIDGTNLLYLILHSQGIDSDVADQPTVLESTGEIVDLIALMYLEELQTVLNRGLAKSYTQTQETEEYLRGTLDMQRQLQQQGPAAPKFECRYSELTEDILLNQAILYAGWILLSATDGERIKRRLRTHVTQLRRVATLQLVKPSELSRVELSRLDNYYRQLLRISETVLRHSFVEGMDSGSAPAYAFTFPTPIRFQQAVHKSIGRFVESRSGWDLADPEYPIRDFLTGNFETTLYVDSVVLKDGEPALAVDAKYTEIETNWTGDWSPDSEHVHKMASYTQYLDVPGVLIYPQLTPGQTIHATSELYTGHDIHLRSMPTLTDSGYREYCEKMDDAVVEIMSTIL